MPVGGGSRSTQSARMPLESVYCSSNVPEQLLQADDAAGKALDLFLRLVDGRKALHDVDEGVVGFLEAFVEAHVDLARDLVEPLVDLRGEPLARVGEVPAEPIALLGQPQMQVGEHRAVLFLEERRNGRDGVLQPALERGDTPRRPGENQERDKGDSQGDFSHGAL